MSIEREHYNGPISFTCDERGCHEFDDTHSSDFSSALAKAKSHGWTVRKVGSEWLHFCPDCGDET